MRREEVAIYPALDKYYLDNRLEHSLTEHDLIIATRRKLYQMIERGPLPDDDVRVAELRIRCVLTHVTDCESLSICRYAAEAGGSMLRASSLRVLFAGCRRA